MSRPWSKVYRSVRAVGGQRNCITLGFPSRCRITALGIWQVSAGEMPSFGVKVFSSKKPCTGASSSSGGVDDPDGYYEATPDAYMPIGPFEGIAGRLEERWDAGYVYENQDGGVSTREYRIYLEITPEGEGDFAYDVSFSCEMEN